MKGSNTHIHVCCCRLFFRQLNYRQHTFLFLTLILFNWHYNCITQIAKLKKVKSDQENLPIFKYKDAMIDMVRKNQVVVIAGDTGCGKSTQVKFHNIDQNLFPVLSFIKYYFHFLFSKKHLVDSDYCM